MKSDTVDNASVTDEAEERAELDQLPQGFRKRTWVTSRILARGALGMIKRTLAPDGPSKPRDPEAATASAIQLVEQLTQLKGLFTKFGQLMSYVGTSLPPQARAALATLQADTTPMKPEVLAEVIREELGGLPSEVFDDFNPSSIAAASIGQVHLATNDGTRVVVKVQYPGIEERMVDDLATLARFVRFGNVFSPADLKPLLSELTERLTEECDYEREANNQRLFRTLAAKRTQVHIPAVVDVRSTKRVLTSEHMHGARWEAFLRDADQSDKNAAAQTIFGFAFGTLFGRALYNCDPTPANYLFRGGGDVVFLDYGCVRVYDKAFIDAWKAQILCVLDGRREEFPDRFTATGLVRRQKGFDWDAQWEALRMLYSPFMESNFQFTPDFVSATQKQILWKNPNQTRTSMPREWLFLGRLQWGMFSILGEMRAQADWKQLFREALEQPTIPLEVSLTPGEET